LQNLQRKPGAAGVRLFSSQKLQTCKTGARYSARKASTGSTAATRREGR